MLQVNNINLYIYEKKVLISEVIDGFLSATLYTVRWLILKINDVTVGLSRLKSMQR